MIQRNQLVDWLNAIQWLKPASITQAARCIVNDHLGKMRVVIEELMANRGISAGEALYFAQTAGHDSPGASAILDDLFSKVKFRGSNAR